MNYLRGVSTSRGRGGGGDGKLELFVFSMTCLGSQVSSLLESLEIPKCAAKTIMTKVTSDFTFSLNMMMLLQWGRWRKT